MGGGVAGAANGPWVDGTAWREIGDPPVFAGADQVTAAGVWPGLPLALVGAPGVVAGVTEFDRVAGPLPMLFAAITWKV